MTPGRRYLLDTNILSETRRSRADKKVMNFLASLNPESLYTSVLTVGELRKGVAVRCRTDPETGASLGAWVDALEHSFADRIIPIDISISRLWGELSSGRTRPVVDTLIAATAMTRGMILVTRNEGDVKGLDLEVINPWRSRKPFNVKAG
ncbi:MAG: type II toxin-antitoxin system VapC family toxin [Acetobacter syzygii]|uniref:type II toxin-antitoxin system VapC family toxin n=1 Tax=Acetobacter syzygii TaxID=146476 RepID=UPI00242B84CE|nr:type II toxin-antitoxin system VapC family toxin [Acetobacter syzygii]